MKIFKILFFVFLFCSFVIAQTVDELYSLYQAGFSDDFIQKVHDLKYSSEDIEESIKLIKMGYSELEILNRIGNVKKEIKRENSYSEEKFGFAQIPSRTSDLYIKNVRKVWSAPTPKKRWDRRLAKSVIWSNDGNYIFFVHLPPEIKRKWATHFSTNPDFIYQLDITTKNSVKIKEFSKPIHDISISPNGEKFVLTRGSPGSAGGKMLRSYMGIENPQAEFIIFNLSNNAEENLFATGSIGDEAHFSPDGNKIIFEITYKKTKDRLGNIDKVYSCISYKDLKSGKKSNFENTKGGQYSTGFGFSEHYPGASCPKWDYDSKHFFYIHREGLCRMKIDGTGEEVIATDVGCLYCLSPDYSKIAFTSGDATYLIFMSRDGTERTTYDLSNHFQDERIGYIEWSPKGKEILINCGKSIYIVTVF